MSFRKLLCLCLCVLFCASLSARDSFSQDRERVVREDRGAESQTPQSRRPPLTNDIQVVQPAVPLVKKTASSRPTAPAPSAAAASSATRGFNAVLRSRMLKSIQGKLGVPYRLGTEGPNRYDCSGFVWSVFGETGIEFTRTSARNFWNEFEPVSGDDRYKFGTLVFFNRLGHVGIVVDEKGFYHASSSRGVMYSEFEGYWEKRITGYRRVPLEKYLY